MPLDDSGKALLRHVRLDTFEIKMLDMIAGRGGEIPWDWTKVKPEAQKKILELVGKGCVMELERGNSTYLRLTDGGRNVVDQIRKMTVKPS